MQTPEFVDRIQKLLQAVGFGLALVHTHIGGNARQHHVATQQQTGFFAIQGDVLGRVPESADATPLAATDDDHIVVLQPFEGARYRRYEVGEIMFAVTHGRQVIRVLHAMQGIKVSGMVTTAKVAGGH